MIITREAARTPSPPSSKPLSSRKPVRIRHPAYDSSTNILFTFASSDNSVVEEEAVYGVHFRLVHTACAIIANNRFDGWIARDLDGQEKLELDDGALLPGGDYYFHVPDTTDPHGRQPDAPDIQSLSASPLRPFQLLPHDARRWSVVPNFREYTFPSAIPDHFNLAVSDPEYTTPGLLPPLSAVRLRDACCLLTAEAESAERAHIIPSSEKEWFGSNGMAQYARTWSGRDAIDSEFNAILLREDVHSLFDRMCFNIVPKPDAKGNWALTAHVSTFDSPGVYKRYHNKRLRTVRGVKPEYLFARFAWDIFPNLRFFLQGGQIRRLAVRQEFGKPLERDYAAKDCAKMCEGQGPGRSASPPKRKRENTETRAAPDDAEVHTPALISDSSISGLEGEVEDYPEEWDSCSLPERDAEADQVVKEFDQEISNQNRRRSKRQQMWQEEDRGRGSSPRRGRKRHRVDLT